MFFSISNIINIFLIKTFYFYITNVTSHANSFWFLIGESLYSITSWWRVRSSKEGLFTGFCWHYRNKQVNNPQVVGLVFIGLCKGLGIFIGLGVPPTSWWNEKASNWMPWKKGKRFSFTNGTNDALWFQFQVAFAPISYERFYFIIFGVVGFFFFFFKLGGSHRKYISQSMWCFSFGNGFWHLGYAIG